MPSLVSWPSSICQCVHAVLGEGFSRYLEAFNPYLLQVLQNTADVEASLSWPCMCEPGPALCSFYIDRCDRSESPVGLCGWYWPGG